MHFYALHMVPFEQQRHKIYRYHASLSCCICWTTSVILIKFARYVAWILICSLNTVNMVKKSVTIPEIYNFPRGLLFWRALYIVILRSICVITRPSYRPLYASCMSVCLARARNSKIDPSAEFFGDVRPANRIFRPIFGQPQIFR